MALNLADFVAMAVLVGLGCMLTYAGLWFMLRHAAAERQQALETQLTALSSALDDLQLRLARLSLAPELPLAAAPAVEKEAPPPAAMPEAVQRDDEQVTPETLVLIAAAVTAFLGKKVRIRSAKILRRRHADANVWSQQGRALVHASHNPRFRG